MGTALTLKARMSTAPMPALIQRTRRLYQPDTRSMWSSYQCSMDSRNFSVSPSALASRFWRDFLSALLPGRALTAVSISLQAVLPWVSGTRKAKRARAKVRPGRYEGRFFFCFRDRRRVSAGRMSGWPWLAMSAFRSRVSVSGRGGWGGSTSPVELAAAAGPPVSCGAGEYIRRRSSTAGTPVPAAFPSTSALSPRSRKSARRLRNLAIDSVRAEVSEAKTANTNTRPMATSRIKEFMVLPLGDGAGVRWILAQLQSLVRRDPKPDTPLLLSKSPLSSDPEPWPGPRASRSPHQPGSQRRPLAR